MSIRSSSEQGQVGINAIFLLEGLGVLGPALHLNISQVEIELFGLLLVQLPFVGLAGMDDGFPRDWMGVLDAHFSNFLPVCLGLWVSSSPSLGANAHEGNLALVEEQVVVKIGNDGTESVDVDAGLSIFDVWLDSHMLAISVVLSSAPWAVVKSVLLGLLIGDGGVHGGSLENVHHL